MDSALLVHRLHFAFTVTFHYLFPQLTMGLAPLIVVLKTVALRRNNESYNKAARFWARIFGINFVLGVVTGIPMEFQFGTNWSHFSRFAGGVIGQTLAMEGMFAFFLESAFLGVFLYGEKKLGPKGHWWAAFAVFLGAWISGFFIIVTDAWMQHPVGYNLAPNGSAQLSSFWALLLNPWAWWQYAHNMSGAVITGAFVMASVGAFYLLWGKFQDYGRIFVRVGVIGALISSVLQVFPTGDGQGRMVALNQPVTLAAMEALFQSQPGAPIVLIGQPDVDKRTIDNPLVVPNALSFLTYRRWKAEVKGLNAFPEDQWPTNIELLYFSYHIMVGLGTIFIAIAVVAAFLMWREKLFTSRWLLWILLMTLPFPYIANTAGWMTAELGRQPWLVYQLMRTADGYSKTVSAGNGMFTLIGFMGMYTVLGILFLFLVRREVERGPDAEVETGH
ncbi:MAG TPA: cytochrome ubiquinol oxidase subunit I [Candidatus Acidoferrum sp.]|jgi:cytochrome d ubiquinol oxidase subunit I|nr:cytochrome ubiquinol oxidase subunit I [Candidatus Acidoferrum sp.]